MPTTPEMTLNEYVHEYTQIGLTGGERIVIYEPLENTACDNLMGELYIGNPGRAPRPAGTFIGTGGQIRFQTINFGLAAVVQGSFDQRTGVIRLWWHKYPGEHVLRISYEFGEAVEERLRDSGPAPLTINWLQEGF